MKARIPSSRTKKCELYLGEVKGYVFKCGADGVGYYRDVPRVLPLNVMVPPDDYHLYTFSAAQWSDIA